MNRQSRNIRRAGTRCCPICGSCRSLNRRTQASVEIQERSMEPVQVERFYLGCLAHASYLVGSEGVAAVIDPQRDVDIYVDAASRLGLRIEHVVETHLHADFVSGHHELAERTGARIYLGDGSGARFPHVDVK